MNVGVVYMDVYVSRYLKEELAWAIDKWLQVINNIMPLEAVTCIYH